jgi:hypothetical protein
MCETGAIRGLHSWMRSRRRNHPDLATDIEMLHRVLSRSERRGEDRSTPAELTADHRIDKKAFIGDAVGGIVGANWLGHNGISVPTRLRGGSYSDTVLSLSRANDLIIFGPYASSTS